MTTTTGPTGGRWTLWNRLRCWLFDHVVPLVPTASGDMFDIYLCCRCNDVARLGERSTGLTYASFAQYCDERGVPGDV